MKKILAMVLSVAIIATIAITGTIAYFTDTEEATNTFTVGNVNIELMEQQRELDTDGNPTTDGALVDFTQGKNLMPIVGSAQTASKDKWGLVDPAGAKNYVDKIVRVKNVGESDAWVRIFVGIPAALDNTENDTLDVLHCNLGNRFDPNGKSSYNESGRTDMTLPYYVEFAKKDASGKVTSYGDVLVGTQTIDGVLYNIYCYTRNEALEPGETTAAVMVGLYLDKSVDYNDEDGYYYMGSKDETAKRITENGVGGTGDAFDLSQPVYIPVYAEAIQAAGFDTADAAFATFNSEVIKPTVSDGSYNPWQDGKMDAVATVVNSSDEMNTAINNGATEIILNQAGTYIIPDSAKGKTLTINGNKNTVVEVQDDNSYEGCDYSFDGANVTFNGVTITTDSHTYAGYARLKATYNNCTINGTYTLYGDSVFNNCTFNVSGDNYNIWTWGAPTAEFNNCIFNCDGKAILLYGGTDTKLTVKNCKFNDNGGVENKAAIEVGSDWTTDKKEIVATNVTVNGFDVTDKGTNTSSTLWGNKNSLSTDRLSVTINGTKVY